MYAHTVPEICTGNSNVSLNSRIKTELLVHKKMINPRTEFRIFKIFFNDTVRSFFLWFKIGIYKFPKL